MKLVKGAKAAVYGARGRKALSGQMQYCIEGAYVTSEQMGTRLGVSAALALRRLKRERAKPSSVTWAGLQEKGGI